MDGAGWHEDRGSSQSRLQLEDVHGVSGSLDALVEALLLVAPHPAAPADLAAAAGVGEEAILQALERLGAAADRGWVLVWHDGLIGLASAPRFAPHVRRFLSVDRESRLSGAALETLAVIAYRQPVSRSEIEAVRGVDCSGVVATLHSRALVEQVGRGTGVGSPILYGTTAAFLHHFGMRSLADLPPLGEVSGKAAAALLDEACRPLTPAETSEGAAGSATEVAAASRGEAAPKSHTWESANAPSLMSSNQGQDQSE
jgi:segregation and condensation protein B